MGMSTHVVGFRPADDLWNRMKKAWESCENAGVPIPKDVLDFFDHNPPGDKPGMTVQIDDAVSGWGDGEREGYEVDVSKLPAEVSVIRFYNSW